MEKYTVQKGIEYLYLRKADVGEFIQKYNADLQKIVQTVQNSRSRSWARFTNPFTRLRPNSAGEWALPKTFSKWPRRTFRSPSSRWIRARGSEISWTA